MMMCGWIMFPPRGRTLSPGAEDCPPGGRLAGEESDRKHHPRLPDV